MKTLTLQLNVASAVLALGQGYKFLDAIWAYPENALDAVQAVLMNYPNENYVPQVWIRLTQDKLTIWDNGIGMNPYMHPNATERAKEYVSGNLTNIVDIWNDPMIDQGSRHSLEWTIQCIALSPKLATLSPTIRGEKGTGANAYLSIANRVDVFTRPHPALAQKGYYPTKRKALTYALTRPTKTELESGVISAMIDEYDEPLSDPFGRPMPHGTIVEISDFHAGVLEKLNAKALARIVSKEAGDQAELVQICSTLPSEKSVTRNKWLRVPNTEVFGKPILLSTLTNRGDNASFAVRIFLDLSGNRKELYVTKRGGKKFLLTEINAFNCFPWNELEGTIEFPEYPGVNTWNPTKTELLNTKQRTFWENTLKALEPTLSDEISKAKATLDKRIFDGLARQTSDAVREVLSKLSAFSGGSFVASPVSSGLGSKAKPTKTHVDTGKIVVTVLTEHQKGYPLAVVELQGNGVKLRKQTGRSGKINFGKGYGAGDYTITLVQLPKDVHLRGNQRVVRKMGKNMEDIGHIFSVETGTPPPEVRHRSPTFKAFFRAFDDPDVPFKQLLKESGVVEFNIATDAFHLAIVNNDEQMKRILIAQYTVGALKQYCDEEQIPFDLYEMSVAFGDLVARLLEDS